MEPEKSSQMALIHMGPAGGNGGKPFDHYDLPENARLTTVHVYSDWVVNALQFDFVDRAERPGGHRPVGGSGGRHQVFVLEADEYLTGISGRAGWYVDSIRFHTNKRESPLYGGRGGDYDFAFIAPPGHEVCGLFGRSDWYLDALGVTIRARIEAADDEESWMEVTGEGSPVQATVVVRRTAVATPEELENLEDSALAEAIAAREGDGDEEGTVDAAVYTQVIEEDDSGQSVAVVVAVAADAGSGIEAVGDEPDEVAVMVTDAIQSEDELAELEEEAIEGAIETLMEGDTTTDEVEVTIYSGVTSDEESGQGYGAVVAVASRVPAAAQPEPKTSAAARVPRPQDLIRVEGIGPKIAELLIENGVLDLADLAQTSVESLKTILEAAGKRFRLADPGTWPEQAKLGAAGAWDRLAGLQEKLKAGRK